MIFRYGARGVKTGTAGKKVTVWENETKGE